MFGKIKVVIVLSVGCLLLAPVVGDGLVIPLVAGDAMDSGIVSIKINGVPYVYGVSPPIALTADEVFIFEVVVKNTGATTWGKNKSEGEHGASLLSRGDPSHDLNDYNETFGTFFILYPMQFGIPYGSNNPTILPGKSWEINTTLRAPGNTGSFTMRWQTAQWPLGMEPGSHITNTGISEYSNPNNYFNRPFFGEEIVVDFIITQRNGQVPVPFRMREVLDQFDFVYEGTFSLPRVNLPGTNTRANKTYINSGITLRKIRDEQGKILGTRMLAVAGTRVNETVLYEVAVPETLGKVVDTDASAVPVAELTITFSGQSSLLINSGGGSEGWSQGSMWYDENTNMLYWTNWANYPGSGRMPSLPTLYYAKLDFENKQVINRESWRLPENRDGAPFGGFIGGVTVIPDSFANNYLNGQKLAIGFGGGGSISSIRSWGPAFGTVSIDKNGTVKNDFNPLMYYPHDSLNSSTHCVRDGNYLALQNWHTNPTSPWDGRWLDLDTIRTGVFIDYKGIKGYMTFVNQGIGRTGYDFGGRSFFQERQHSWYFYDFETLGKAATGEISKVGLTPSSYNVVNYPTTHANPGRSTISNTHMTVTGSYFDHDTGLLYLYVKAAYGNEPFVHVYRFTERNEYIPQTPGNSKQGQTTDVKNTRQFPCLSILVLLPCIIAYLRISDGIA